MANTMKKTYNISSTLKEITATNQKRAHIPYGDAGLPVDVGQSHTSAADDYNSAFQEDKEVEGILGQVELEMSSDCDTTDTQKHEHQNKEMTGQEINSDNSKDETCDSHAEDDDIVITGEGTCRVQQHKNRVMCEDEFNIIKTGQMLTDTSIKWHRTSSTISLPTLMDLRTLFLDQFNSLLLVGSLCKCCMTVAFIGSVCLILVVQRELLNALTATTTGDTLKSMLANR